MVEAGKDYSDYDVDGYDNWCRRMRRSEEGECVWRGRRSWWTDGVAIRWCEYEDRLHNNGGDIRCTAG